MERKIFKIHLDCSKCRLPLTILEIGANSLGDLFADCLCLMCAREIKMQIDMRITAEMAAHPDVRYEMMNTGIN